MSMEHTRTILLAAWGGNNGHVVHCARLGRIAVDRGWRAVVVHEHNDVYAGLVREAGCESRTYRRDLTTDNDRWHCWHSERYVMSSVESDLRLLDDVRPDVIVHDVRPSIPVAAERMEIPHAAICHCTYLPGFSFAGLGTSELWLGGLDEFNRVLDAWGQPPISRDLRARPRLRAERAGVRSRASRARGTYPLHRTLVGDEEATTFGCSPP
jgi:hypothetical protein